MTVNEFLARHVDGQILGDLEAMATLAASGGQGGVGYPIVMTVFSGCELLGRLMVPGNTRAAFVAYWVEHLYPGTDRAGAEALYRLVRSGTGPGFVAMPGIQVTTCRSQDHLSTADGAFVIDALTLHDDFRASYTRARGNLVAQGEPALLELLSWLETEHAELVRRLPAREPAEASSEPNRRALRTTRRSRRRRAMSSRRCPTTATCGWRARWPGRRSEPRPSG